MSANLIVITGIIYAYIAIDQVIKNNYPMAVVYFGYAAANMGLVFAVK